MSESSEVPDLPDGAVLRFVRTGGMRAQTDELLLFADGRVRRMRSLRRQTLERRASADEIRKVLADLVLCGFFEMQSAAGEARPDAFTYEFTVRSGDAARTLVVHDGAVPASLVPVLAALRQMLG